jgi:hypothetical protein
MSEIAGHGSRNAPRGTKTIAWQTVRSSGGKIIG